MSIRLYGFSELASVAREIALIERLNVARLEAHAVELARAGTFVGYDPATGLSHLRWRLARIEAGASLLEQIAPHEDTVRRIILPDSPEA